MDLDALAYLSVTRLYASYADVVTRRAWAELDALFLPDAPVHVDRVNAPPIELVGPAAFGEFVAGSIARFEFFEFVILNHVVRVHGDGAARGRLYMVELRQDSVTGEWSNAFGVYHDDVVVAGGAWRFAERRYQSLARKLGPGRAEVFPFPGAHSDL
ncbi:MAG TPA: nuclear transport factor 2 family protein [Acidimicrobiales bacterium]|nr:nuclear transport factor 2 family protein [Acidimicrobiales bacterium]